MILRDIAHTRSGDKGDTANIAVFAYRDDDFPMLESWLTADRVAQFYADIVTGTVTRHVLPELKALNFVMTGALGGGVTRSLNLDAHGKCLASAILAMPIPDPA